MMRSANNYKILFTRYVPYKNGQVIRYSEAEQYWGYWSGNTIHLRGIPTLAASDRLYDPNRDIRYDISKLEFSDDNLELVAHVTKE